MSAVSDPKPTEPDTADAALTRDGAGSGAGSGADAKSGNRAKSVPSTGAAPALRIRYRIRFAKQGLLRWISHRDLARLWERMLRRGEFQLSMTEGFHPKPRIGFPSALALGVDGLEEVVEIELSEDLPPQEVLRRLLEDRQPGLTVHRVCKLPQGFGKAQLLRSDYTITVPENCDTTSIPEAIARLMAEPTIRVERKKKAIQLETREQVLDLELVGPSLRLSLAATTDSASLRPGDVLNLLGLSDWMERGSLISRTGVILLNDLESRDPAVMAESTAIDLADASANLTENESDRGT